MSNLDENMTYLIEQFVFSDPLYNSSAKLIEITIMQYSVAEQPPLSNLRPPSLSK